MVSRANRDLKGQMAAYCLIPFSWKLNVVSSYIMSSYDGHIPTSDSKGESLEHRLPAREETPTTHPRYRVQTRSTTPPDLALGEPPICYRKKNGGPIMVKSARKRTRLPHKRNLAARDPEDRETGEEPPRQRPCYHPTNS
ncbi:hypothetical protein L1987_57903 [Smallanthus sonchifolius]|uniref:Uncharacterized protein n=1 Tax=Smallanthus sonchifolius TaxID=185202 RepID=A0ACB9DE52_9ASTR|nr:hypothetical protein L1987_57903 [Smallanthus sonchifolius]